MADAAQAVFLVVVVAHVNRAPEKTTDTCLERPLRSTDGRHVDGGGPAASGVYQKRRDKRRTDMLSSPVHCTIKMPRCQLSEGS